ncbi:hypothetical protein YC2023_039901 [Brassica napus]
MGAAKSKNGMLKLFYECAPKSFMLNKVEENDHMVTREYYIQPTKRCITDESSILLSMSIKTNPMFYYKAKTKVLLYCDSVTTEDLSSSSVPLRLLNTPNTASVTSSVSVLHLLKSHHLFEPTTHPTLSQLNIVIIIKGNRSKLFSINVFLLYDEKPHCYIISNSRRCQALNPTMDNSYTFLSNTQRSAFSGFECQESGPTDECQHALPE